MNAKFPPFKNSFYKVSYRTSNKLDNINIKNKKQNAM